MALQARKVSRAFEKWAPGQRHCVMLLDKTLNSHSASLHPEVKMGTSKLLGIPNKLRDFAMALKARKVSRAFKKRALVRFGLGAIQYVG